MEMTEYLDALVTSRAEVDDLTKRIEAEMKRRADTEPLLNIGNRAHSGAGNEFLDMVNSASKRKIEAAMNLPLAETAIGRARLDAAMKWPERQSLEAAQIAAIKARGSDAYKRETAALNEMCLKLKAAEIYLKKLLKANPATKSKWGWSGIWRLRTH